MTRERHHSAGSLLTPLGRRQVVHRLFRATWPLTSRAARLYRSTLITQTRVAAVVGSFGKSTTARCVWTVLGGKGRGPSQRNSWSFLSREVLRIRPGTPWAVLEVGISSVGWMARYAKMLKPDVAVVTSIGSEHGRTFGSLEATRSEKAAMVGALPESGVAVLNGDDPNVRWMEGTTRSRVVTYGFDSSNKVVGSDYRLDWPHGSLIRIDAGGESRRVKTRLIGRHSVYALLAAVAVAVEADGQSLEEVVGLIEDLPPTPGRMQPVELSSGAWLLRDDNKSALETVDAALDTLSEIPARRRIVVLGAVSEPPGRQRQLYRDLGAKVAAIARQTVLICGRKTFEAYRAGGRAEVDSAFSPIPVRGGVRAAIDWLQEELREGDVVLIKGRDTQRLERVALALQGRTVGCDLSMCDTRVSRCEDCSMLAGGWRQR